jgi:hypothetical protein
MGEATEFRAVEFGNDILSAGKGLNAVCETRQLSGVKRTPDHAGVVAANDPKQTFCDLFDHLVGAAEQRKRNGDAECLSALEIDDQFNLCRLLDCQIGGFFALEDSTSVDSDQTICIDKTAAIAGNAT